MVSEVTGKRKDGSLFPLELSVSESIEDDKKIFVGILRDISERKLNELAIESANRERNLILNTAGEGIYGLDLKGNITFVNPAACKMLGYSEEELWGKPQHSTIHHSHPDGTEYPREECPIYAAVKDGKDHHETEEVFWKKDGSSFPVEYMSRPIIDKGELIGTVVTFTDISARKAAENELHMAYNKLEERIEERTQELNSAKEMAESHNQAKSEFLSRMSHELRTPMNAILGFAQIMNESQKDPLSNSHKSRLNQILKAGNHLLELINEVLNLARIEAGKISVSLEPVRIDELVRDVLNVTKPVAEKFGIELIDEISAYENFDVLADKTRLNQVLLNLVSNGIKYNRKEGSVTLSLAFKNPDRIIIQVTDTGMGIPSEKLEKIFEPFDRLGAENSNTEGTGIGMTISKKLVELMNGNLTVKSEPGIVSCFSVSLPTCDNEVLNRERDLRPFDKKCAETRNNKFHILYIEDNEANMLLVQDILSDFHGIELLKAPRAEMGLDMAHAHRPDLILLDINLPGIDGLETLKRLQNMEETHEIPVIAISANAMEKDINRALKAGFKNYLTKPLNISEFKAVVEKYAS
ncbi:MAG: PAS domain S-box protein [Nitrospinae bacterium]|nr:PAS domain S-box protein [Nitrospinota bacterium]